MLMNRPQAILWWAADGEARMACALFVKKQSHVSARLGAPFWLGLPPTSVPSPVLRVGKDRPGRPARGTRKGGVERALIDSRLCLIEMDLEVADSPIF